MKLKKLTALFMAAMMVLGCLVGCGNQNTNTTTQANPEKTDAQTTVGTEDQPTETETQSLYNVGSLPIVNEPITLKVLTTDRAAMKGSDAGIWAWLEEKTGIHFEVESYSADEMKTKLPLIMVTPDEMPDLFIHCDFTAADIVQYGQNGQLLQLDDLIEQYGENIKTMWEETETGYGASVSSDGHVYSVPAMNGEPTYIYYAINTRFLENSGIEKIPSTFEEFVDAMLKMRECDANGDGTVGNELLWSAVPKVFKRQALGMVGINCYWPWQGCLFDDKDGEVYFVPTSEEYKYLMTNLRKLYAAGCIDPEVFSQSANEYKSKFYQDLTFIGERIDDPENKGYTGQSGSAYIPPFTSAVHDEPLIICGADYQINYGSISAYTEYPEICMLLLDYLYTEEATKVSTWGLDGVDHKLVSEDPWRIQKLNDDLALEQGPTCLPMPKWIKTEWLAPATTTLKQTLADYVNEYVSFAWQNYINLTQEEADTVSVISADLGLFCDSYFAGFITGEYDIEKDWDQYVKTCEGMMLAELTAVYQTAYDRFMGN